MNYALIFAGGVGRRMQNGALPKQFLELDGKPIIIYTLEQFEKNKLIDGIIIVCVTGWEDFLQRKIDQFSLKKVKKILTGGESAIQSQFIGLKYIEENFDSNNDTIILLHDGVRPLIDQNTINNNVKCAKEKGSAITVVPATETIGFSKKKGEINQLLDRARCVMARAPQTFRGRDIFEAHLKAQKKGMDNFIDSATLMNYFNYPLYTVEGSTKNIKVTTPADYFIFKAIIEAQKNEQIFGGNI